MPSRSYAFILTALLFLSTIPTVYAAASVSLNAMPMSQEADPGTTAEYTIMVNNDGENDIFSPIILGEDSYVITIYDRWGSIIYMQEDGGWDGLVDGKAVPLGIYPYSISVRDFNQRLFIYPGTVKVIR